MKYSFNILIMITFYSCLYADEPANKLMVRYINAIGGESNLMQMKSISRSGYIKFYDSNKTYCYKTDIIYPIKLREQIKNDEILIDRGTDGKIYWSWTGKQYDYTHNDELIKYLRGTAERANRDMIYVIQESKNFEVMHSTPDWAPNNTQCIQQIEPKVINNIFCFDNYSGLLVGIAKDQDYRIESDWKQIDTIKIPFILEHYHEGKLKYKVQLGRVKLNQSIPDTQFVKPNNLQNPLCE